VYQLLKLLIEDNCKKANEAENERREKELYIAECELIKKGAPSQALIKLVTIFHLSIPYPRRLSNYQDPVA